MKSLLSQSLNALLALFILAAAVTPACAGGEQCRMACCRHKALPAPHHPADASSTPCCTHPADASADSGSSCRPDQQDLAIHSHERTSPAAVADGLADANRMAAPDPAGPLPRAADFAEPPKSPLFLRTQLLLI